ncbi:MAG: hypothetical protein MZW92_72895 [Comamonadaceae bacterium]|nr:hypothetical protein [Comamonadaceae bacterium]
MPVIAVVNPKAEAARARWPPTLPPTARASAALAVMLGDVDRQKSTLVPWLRRRSTAVGGTRARRSPAGWSTPTACCAHLPGVTHVVLDTPGGLQGVDIELARTIMWRRRDR